MEIGLFDEVKVVRISDEDQLAEIEFAEAQGQFCQASCTSVCRLMKEASTNPDVAPALAGSLPEQVSAAALPNEQHKLRASGQGLSGPSQRPTPVLGLRRAIHARSGCQARRDNVLPQSAEFGVHRPRRLERIHGAQEA
jgi:hypothetical protein